jgi:GAF domain-containing protein
VPDRDDDWVEHRAAAAWIGALADLARDLQGRHPDPAAAAPLVTDAALQLVPGADVAAVSVVGKGRSVTTFGATDPVAVALDTAQQQAGEGPSVTDLWTRTEVLADDLASDPRWPAYARAAVAGGIRSLLAVRLYLRSAGLGALVVYSRVPSAFDDRSRRAADVFGAHAAAALDQARHREQLATALAGRDLIGQAKGILMERHGIDEDAAFAMLVRASQLSNTPLRQVAERLTWSGEMPTDPAVF